MGLEAISGICPVELAYVCHRASDPVLASSQPPVLFIHGHGSSKETWKPVLAAFEGRTCYAIDLRGHGHSALGDERTFSLEALALDVQAFCTRHGLDSPVVVAHSMGARVAIAAGALFPSLFKGVLMVDMEMKPHFSQPLEVAELVKLKAFKDSHREEASMRQHLESFGYGPSRIDGFLRENRIERTDDGFRVWVNPYAEALARSRIWTSSKCENYFQQVAQNHLPVGLLKAERESEVSEEGLAWMQQVYPKMWVETVNDCDHRIHKTATEAFIQKVEAFYRFCLASSAF